MRTLKGTVVSNAMQKTVGVRVDSYRQHPIYNKRYLVSNKFLAHVEEACEVGDSVLMVETKPMSKRKRWKVTEIIKKNS